MTLEALSEQLSPKVLFGPDFLPGKKVLATPSAGQREESPYSSECVPLVDLALICEVKAILIVPHVSHPLHARVRESLWAPTLGW